MSTQQTANRYCANANQQWRMRHEQANRFHAKLAAALRNNESTLESGRRADYGHSGSEYEVAKYVAYALASLGDRSGVDELGIAW